MKDIILIGGGGHCKAVIDVLEQEGRFNIIGIIDKPELLGKNVLGYPIIGNDSELNNLIKRCENVLITIGQIRSPLPRINLFDTVLKLGFTLPSVVSPRAYVSQYASIGKGSVIMHDVVVNAGAKIGDNCIINTKSIVEHGSNIGDHCHISTNAVINGDVVVGSGSFIGSSAVTKEGIRINDNFFAKAGSIIK
ncbi:NeuD/PglB/VioB family sugar acetyltransferase [Candidatus Thioglobus autotrophicus]|uniref:NeuD/PglB/VioB family sugar acetyltransferase n=1 Tax=Candidatus Thioglobus autotrophicus TaxID=1705394 RepID=UPI00299DB27D|nr:NeuD/PglB/VioB family sugar acetyltransferase [Candidatus Thioglobus autotrophicus]WPE17767.1 NeuD/PglB/VioB family sugar acetyltransferase [Candidatus Thioglobus autotrophicus]